MKNLRNSITSKILLLILFVGLFTLLLVGTYAFYSARQAIIRRTIEQLISVRTFKKQQITAFFEAGFRELSVMTTLSEKENVRFQGKSTTFSKVFRVSQTSETEIYGDTVLISGQQRRMLRNVAAIPGPSGQKVTDFIIDSSFIQYPKLYIVFTPANERGKEPFSLMGEIPASEITKILLHENLKSGLGKSGEAYMVGSDGLMRSESRFVKGALMKMPVMTEPARKAITGETGAEIATDYRGIRVFSAYEPLGIKGLPWVILAEIDYEEAMVPVVALRNDIMLVSIVISLLILGFAQLISKMVTQPIIRLKNAARGLGQGNFDQKVEIDSTDEIGLLAGTFNAMSEQLREERRKRMIALYAGQEMERKRISRELHDGLGQKLVGTKLQIENCSEDDPSCLSSTLSYTKSGIHDIIEELRRISNDLMPAALEELGLEAAIRNLCRFVAADSHLAIDCDVEMESPPHDQKAVFLFRICQEALQNVVKHAGASLISVQLIENRESVILIIEDDGAGFDIHAAVQGSGLINMKERASLLGGTFSIESTRGTGTTIRVKLPKSIS
jgi:signal transduction histidine kinase